MFKHYPQPIIIGSGLTGLLISLELSKAQIDHVLIGGPPPSDGPRVGESLNLEATIYFLAEYPELADCYYQKGFAATHSGDITGFFDFSFISRPDSAPFFATFGKKPPELLIHFDRVRLDAALYEKAINAPFCTQLDGRVSALHCAAGSDHIQQIVMEDGSTIPVAHVFDATGHIRLVARQLRVPRQMLGPTQYGVFTHYYRCEGTTPHHADGEWQHGTSVLRLYAERDGFDGLAWCIPLGDTISVGVTTPLTETMAEAPPADETLLAAVQKAFALYDVHYAEVVEKQSRVGRARIEFYTHACTHGANWLLASAAHTQIWWPTSSGIDTSVAAALVAAQFIRNPKQVGARYQDYMATLAQSQSVWNWAATHSHGSISPQKARRFADRLFWSIGARFAKSLTLDQRNPLSQLGAALTANLYANEFWSQMTAPAEVRQHHNV